MDPLSLNDTVKSITDNRLNRMVPEKQPDDKMEELIEKLVMAFLTNEYDPRTAYYNRKLSKIIHRLKAEAIGSPCRMNVQLANQIMAVEMGVEGRGLESVKDALRIICSRDSHTVIERIQDKPKRKELRQEKKARRKERERSRKYRD